MKRLLFSALTVSLLFSGFPSVLPVRAYAQHLKVPIPKPFGLEVGKTTEEEFKKFIARKGWDVVASGYRIIRDNITNPNITGYKVKGLPLEKLDSAYFWFYKGKLMKIDYRLSEDMAKSTFKTYYDLLVKKYGSPVRYRPPNLQDGEAVWNIRGVKILLYVPWVSSTTYLQYIDPELNRKADISDREVYRKITARKAKNNQGI